LTAPSALLIRVTGHDRPGLTYALTSILARYGVRVLDLARLSSTTASPSAS
jgi:predicted amino acid-binding ACT domain protein